MAPGTSIDLQFRMVLMCAFPLRYMVSMVIGAQPGAQPVVVRLVTSLTERSIHQRSSFETTSNLFAS